MFHQEADGIAAAPATETFIDLLGGRYRKGRRLLVMKRTKPQVVGAPFFEFYEPADHFRDVDAAEDLLYGLRRDQDKLFEPEFNLKNHLCSR